MAQTTTKERPSPASFFRFDQLKPVVTNPHLSTGKGGIFEGAYINVRNNNKEAGTGSDFHYHPNELLIFVIRGKLNALVGRDRRIVSPGTFVHVPPNAGHQMQAAEDGAVSYLYIKDRTWSLVGVAADEAPPDEAPTLEAVAEAFGEGRWPGQDKAPEKSKIIVDGLGDCFYPVTDLATRTERVANRLVRIGGHRLAFSYFETCQPDIVPDVAGGTEQFIYVLAGSLDIEAGRESRTMGPGDAVVLARDCAHSLRARAEGCRIAIFNALPSLQALLDEKRGS